jgi:glutathione peroxidase
MSSPSATSRLAPSTALAVLLAALVLAACGSDGSGQSGSGAAMRGGAVQPGEAPSTDAAASSSQGTGVLDGTLPRLNGEPDDLARYRGEVVLVVNTATECGFTPQFEGLERLYRERRSDGFVILGFPADDVAHQEPRSDEAIAEFCKANFGVTFPMFAKSNVVDDPVNPVFAKLDDDLGEPSWNFNKYLLDRRGRPVERFDQTTAPDDPELAAAIDRLVSR